MNTESQQCRQLLLLLLHLLLLHSWVSVPTVRWAMKPFRFLRGVRWQRNNYAETDWGDAAIDSSTGTLIGWVTWTKEDATGFSMLQTEAIMANICTKIRGELNTSHVAYSDLGLCTGTIWIRNPYTIQRQIDLLYWFIHSLFDFAIICQSTNRSISRSVNQSICQSVELSISHSVNQPFGQSVNRSLNQSVQRCVLFRSINYRQSVSDQLINKSVTQLASQSVDQSVFRLFSQNSYQRLRRKIVRAIMRSGLNVVI